jgi:putative FmdB family regulatory protein
MPVYEYECKKCSERLLEERPMSEADLPKGCERCGSQLKRIYNFGSVTFKGSGFYRTDK